MLNMKEMLFFQEKLISSLIAIMGTAHNVLWSLQ